MFTRFKALAAGIVLLAMTAMAAGKMPAAADSTREAQIRGRVLGLIEQLGGGPGAARYDAVEVKRDGDGYGIAVAGLVLTTPDGVAHHIGDVQARLMPAGARYDDIALTLPESWHYVGRSGRRGDVRLGRQRIDVRWDAKLAASTTFLVEFGEAEVRVAGDPPAAARIDAISLRSALVDKDGRWSGPVRFHVQGFVVGDGDTFARIDDAKLDADVIRADLLRLYAAAAPADDGAAEPPAVLGGLDLTFAVQGLLFDEAAKGRLALKEASYRLNMPNADQPQFDAKVELRQNGLTATGAFRFWSLLNLRIDLLIEQVRSAELSRRLLAAALEPALVGDQDSEDGGAVGPGLSDLVAAMAGAAEAIRIDGEQSSPTGFGTRFDGQFRSAPQAASGWVGQLQVKVVEPTAIDETVPRSARPYLEGVRAMGRPDPDGSSLHYHFDIKQDGSVDLNGNPLLPPPSTGPQAPSR